MRLGLVERLLDHAQTLRLAALPPAVVEAAVAFITDSIGVALAGSRHPRLPQVQAAAALWGRGDEAVEWRSGRRWPAPTAALLNAWQIHNQEFDCVHERAVVHPLATVLPALVAQAERSGASGAALIEAVVLAVDAAAAIGESQAAPMRFFRPAMCGALGATLGLARLARLSRAQTADALGLAHGQLAGTMQAHLEGSPALALQVGLAARAAVCALDLAQAGFAGPHDVLEGPFGYFALFDAPLEADGGARRAAVAAQFDSLGSRYRIAELSHKPYPTGRAAHGALDGLATLCAQHALRPQRIVAVELAAPPLVLRLVGRPARADMDVNYARLCLPYLVASWLIGGELGLDDFSAAALRDPARLARAAAVRWQPNHVTDPNALAPQTVSITLDDGRRHAVELPAVLGHPQRPLAAEAQRRKFAGCADFAGLDAAAAGRLHAACAALPAAERLAPWLALMAVAGSTAAP